MTIPTPSKLQLPVSIPGEVVEDGWIRCKDGVILPLKAETVSAIRGSPSWTPHPACEGFNKLFYRAFRNIRFRMETVRDDMQVLLPHAEEVGLTRHEARLLYGYEHGVIGKSGRFLKAAGLDAADKLDAAGAAKVADSKRPLVRFSPDDWEFVERDAIEACQGMADTADMEAEAVWVGCRAREWPDFKTAPSRMAVKFWLSMNDPKGTNAFERDFFRARYFRSSSQTVFTGRLRGAEEDVEVDPELHRKLFGNDLDGGEK